jgi:hypothetical protein
MQWVSAQPAWLFAARNQRFTQKAVALMESLRRKNQAGARAVQIYTGFIYEGPAAVKRINRGLIRLMERDGF